MSAAAGSPRGSDRDELIVLLNDLTRAVEELLLTGLGAASDKTRQTLAVSFQKASAKKLFIQDILFFGSRVE